MGNAPLRQGVYLLKKANATEPSIYLLGWTADYAMTLQTFPNYKEIVFVASIHERDALETIRRKLKEKGAIIADDQTITTSASCNETDLVGTVNHWTMVVEKMNEGEGCTVM